MSDFCLHKRIVKVNAKCVDCFDLTYGDREYNGYVPEGLNLGGGDYLEFAYCLDCGKIMGNFPITEEEVQEAIKESED